MTTFGYSGRILRVDLTSGAIDVIDTWRYAPDLVGGVGIAAGIAWDELPPGVGPFDPENLLMLMVGPLTGTMAAGAGRTAILGVAPQLAPPRFSRSSMGGHWGAELRYAGYDGLVMSGAAPRPCYLWIQDGRAELLDAADLWGLSTQATALALRRRHDPRARVVSIGPAGENRSRIATLVTETENTAGQGGYGGVMGAKNVKAVVVRGTGGVPLADARGFLAACLADTREHLTIADPGADPRWPAERPVSTGTLRHRKCGFCANVCTHPLYMGVPGRATGTTHTTAQQCYGFHVSRGSSAETRAVASAYGLNGWEIAYGMIPWLQLCRQHGLIDAIDGHPIPAPEAPIAYLRDASPWPGSLVLHLLELVAHRRGEFGAALAEGTCYAAEALFGGQGRPLLDRIYPGRRGQTDHWTGVWGGGGNPRFPWSLPVILQWLVDTRDPASDCSHHWVNHAVYSVTQQGRDWGRIPLEQVRAICQRVYGHPDVLTPGLTYDPPDVRAIPAIWHTDRGMIADSLVVCEQSSVRLFTAFVADYSADTGLLARLFEEATGLAMSDADLQRAGERISNLLRAIDVRNHGRRRTDDEEALGTVWRCPDRDDGIVVDPERFWALLDRYYELRGWDVASGRPTGERLRALGLGQVADVLATQG